MAARLLLLVCVAAGLLSAEAQDAYSQLPDVYKKGVDLALEQLNSHAGVKHHFRFFKSVDKSEHDVGFGTRFLYHHFYLKPTRCAKGATISDLQSCPFRNDRPLMDCAVCYKTQSDQLEDSPAPYVHCIHKPRLTQAMTTTRWDHWKTMTYSTGGATIMALSTG
uniref:Retinoic acid receptor responder protein 2 n=1 Tax=Fundulus heteroclitus TaxID=8078 RepID=A0A3Q2PQY8_FUNHE